MTKNELTETNRRLIESGRKSGRLEHMVSIFREVRRVLKPYGCCWVNMGDGFSSGKRQGHGTQTGKQSTNRGSVNSPRPTPGEVPDKCKILLPHRLAIAMIDDGWICRQDNVWCLSGGTWVYVRSQKGDMPMTLKDLARLDPSTVQLWDGVRWAQLLGMGKTPRSGAEIEFVLRSGERISCTPEHQWPTMRGLLRSSEIRVGDALVSCRLPEPENPRDCLIGNDAAWLAGVYLAEGCLGNGAIQISGHANETKRLARLEQIAAMYGGSLTCSVDGNNQNIRIYGKVLLALVAELISGYGAKNKGIAPVAWRYSNEFLQSLLDGYLSGDGGYDAQNDRWRLGFCRNYTLERDLRTLCARLGHTLTLNLAHATCEGKKFDTFRGEIRFRKTNHQNSKNRNEIVEIRKARCRYVYDLSVEGEPHLFALASGVLTHNCKPQVMPESVRDRTTTSHEYIFQFVKQSKYYYNADAIKELASVNTNPRSSAKVPQGWDTDTGSHGSFHKDGRRLPGVNPKAMLNGVAVDVPNSFKGSVPGRKDGPGQDRRSSNSRLGDKNSQAADEVKSSAGARMGRGAGWRNKQNESFSAAVANLVEYRNCRSVWTIPNTGYKKAHFATFPEEIPRRRILASTRPGDRVLDIFGGSGTTGAVAVELGRTCDLIELNPAYIEFIVERVSDAQVPLIQTGE